MGKRRYPSGHTSAALAAVLWGGSIVAQKMALTSFSAVEASVLRDIGGLAILLATWWSKEGGAVRLSGVDIRLLGLLGLVVLGTHLFILMGLDYVSGGVIIGSSPVVTSVLSALLLNDVPLRAVWAGALLSFAGVGVVCVVGALQHRQSFDHRADVGRDGQLDDADGGHGPSDPTALDRSKNDECRDWIGHDFRLVGAWVPCRLCDGSGTAGLVIRRQGCRSVTGLGVRESGPSGSDWVVGPDLKGSRWFD